jgi:DnaK suppressor protein
MALSTEEKSAIKRQIEDEIEKLESQLCLNRDSAKTVELDQSLAGRVSRIDAIQQQKMAQAAEQRNRLRLLSLKAVLNKIDTEDFGLCEECAEPISIERLKIKPESLYCLSCQALLEQINR